MEQIAGQLIASIATIVVAGLVLVGTVYQSRAQRRQAANDRETAAVATQIDGWDRLAEQHLKEIERLEGRVAEEQAVTKTFATRCQALEDENRRLRALVHQEDRGDEGTIGS